MLEAESCQPWSAGKALVWTDILCLASSSCVSVYRIFSAVVVLIVAAVGVVLLLVYFLLLL